MICTLWTPFQAERDWKNSYREILLIPLYIFYSLCIDVKHDILKIKINVYWELNKRMKSFSKWIKLIKSKVENFHRFSFVCWHFLFFFHNKTYTIITKPFESQLKNFFLLNCIKSINLLDEYFGSTSSFLFELFC